jgi:CheY-like chemotaxis protein
MRHQPMLFNQLKFPGSFAAGLRAEFAEVVAEPVPERLMALVRKLQASVEKEKRRLTKSRTKRKLTKSQAKTRKRTETMGQTRPHRRTALIVEDDADLRELSAALLEESELDTIECESAEAALATMLLRGQDVAMIFADIRLPGVMDGVDLAREVKLRWPHLTVVLTSGNPGGRLDQLPPGVQYMPKPWQPLNVLMVAERARLAAQRR